MAHSEQTNPSMESGPSGARLAAFRPGLLADVFLAIGFVAFLAAVIAMVASWGGANAPWYAGELALLAAAGFVRIRLPTHPLVGWFCAGIGLGMAGFVLTDLAMWAGGAGTAPGKVVWLNFAGQMATTVSAITVLPFLALFPTGEVRGRLERRALHVSWMLPLIPCFLLLVASSVALPASYEGTPVPNPMHLGGFSIGSGAAQTLIDLVNLVFVAAAVLLVRRYRRSGRSDRKAIRWLLLPVILAVFMAVLGALFTLPGVVFAVLTVVMSAAFGMSAALGLVRPEGVDIDDVLRGSLLYGLLWLLIAGAYDVAHALLGLEVGEWASVSWAVAVTMLALLLLRPLQGLLQRRPGRWLFGSASDPRRAIASLGESLAETYDLETLLPQIANALEEGLGVEWARVRLSAGSPPAGTGAALAVPIALDGEALGVVEIGPKLKGELTVDDQAVVATLASQAALAVRNVKLTRELQDRTTELTASRARLVRAEEAERRRIERNIHDGVQQELVALIGQSGLLRRRLKRQGVIRSDDLERLQAGLQDVLVELRELSTGIHPSLLRDHGLLVAVEALAARHPVPTQVRADAGLVKLRMPSELEGAAYYTVAESLANSLKHADAERCDVTLTRVNGTMSLRIEDDGNGFDQAHTGGSGLDNLSERLAAIGGELTVSSQPGHGTTITASMPLKTPAENP